MRAWPLVMVAHLQAFVLNIGHSHHIDLSTLQSAFVQTRKLSFLLYIILLLCFMNKTYTQMGSSTDIKPKNNWKYEVNLE